MSLVPSPPHIFLESNVCSLNPGRPPQRVNSSHYTINTVQNRWQLGWMGPPEGSGAVGSQPESGLPWQAAGALGSRVYPCDVLGQASARTCGWHSVRGPLPPGCMAKCSQPWHHCPLLGSGTTKVWLGWVCVPMNHSFHCFNLVCYRAVHILGLWLLQTEQHCG